MKLGDPFVEGLRRVFAEREDLTPAGASRAAGLSTSTIRKILTGEGSSPKVITALRICDEIGVPLSEVIRIGTAAQREVDAPSEMASSDIQVALPAEEVAACGGSRGQIVRIAPGQVPMHGDLVVVAVRGENGQATHLGRYAPPFIIGAMYCRDAAAIWRISDASVIIQGAVTGFADPPRT